jgi:hypothetical protein
MRSHLGARATHDAEIRETILCNFEISIYNSIPCGHHCPNERLVHGDFNFQTG